MIRHAAACLVNLAGGGKPVNSSGSDISDIE
jgi:hypothetical protein